MAAFLRNLKQSVLGSCGVAHEGVVEFLQNCKINVLISIFRRSSIWVDSEKLKKPYPLPE